MEERRGGGFHGVIYAMQRPYYPLYMAVGQEECTIAERRDGSESNVRATDWDAE